MPLACSTAIVIRLIQDAPSANISKHNCSDWVAVDLREWFSIHFPGQHHLMDAHFAVRYGDHVIVNLSFLEVCINAYEL